MDMIMLDLDEYGTGSNTNSQAKEGSATVGALEYPVGEVYFVRNSGFSDIMMVPRLGWPVHCSCRYDQYGNPQFQHDHNRHG